MPPNLPHAKTSAGGFTDIYIHISNCPLSQNPNEEKVYILQDDVDKSFQTLAEMALKHYHIPSPNHRFIVNALYDTMHQFLVGWNEKAKEPIEDIELIKIQIANSFSDPEFSISALLLHSGYNIDHIRRKFRLATGTTPVEYLTTMRISYAKTLLDQFKLLHYSIAEIGTLCGYYDPHYFSRIFKKKTGLSPEEYKSKVSKTITPTKDPLGKAEFLESRFQ